MKRALILPALAVGFLIWACDGPPTEPDATVVQSELMNFVSTPQWPDLDGDGLYCAEDMAGQLIEIKCIEFVNRPPKCRTNVTCRDDNVEPGQVIEIRCIEFVDREPVCIGPCGVGFNLVSTDQASGSYFSPSNCNGGPPQG